MDWIAGAIGGVISFFFLFTAFAFYFQRLRWKRNKRLGKKDLGFCPTFSYLGNALQRAQQLAQPQVKMMMQEEDAAEDSDDEEELAKNGIQHLHRQLKHIRNGDEIDKLTVPLRFWHT